MSYSKEEKASILGRFHASGLSAREACKRYPEFPHPQTLGIWIREQDGGGISPSAIEVKGKCTDHALNKPYPTATKKEAVRLVRNGYSFSQAAKRLNVRSADTIRQWAGNAARVGSVDAYRAQDGVRASALARVARGERVRDVAADIDVNARTVYRWAEGAGLEMRAYRRRKKGDAHVEDSPDGSCEKGEWARAWGDLPDDPRERARLAEVRLAEALAVLDVLKAPGPSSLTNAEKHRAGEKARKTAKEAALGDVLADFSIAKSTYLSQGSRASKPDKYAALRERIRFVFESSEARFGSESVWAALRRGEGAPIGASRLAAHDMRTPVVVSEKVVRRIMREEGLVCVQRRRGCGRYSSYAGEPDERPANVPLAESGAHCFHAQAPGELVVTDVTEFKLSGFKAYLSPAIDCFDGMPIAWTVSRHADDDLTCSMLEQVAEGACGRSTVLHSDGGGNYRSNRWKGICDKAGITRSMSRKGTSPDNARAEGFFGTLKQEFFYARDWTGISYKGFVAELDRYIVWYRDEKIKKGLGWKTLAEHRAALEVA